MTLRLRRFIFLIFTGFFIISSFIVIFFAEGYRFDFNSFKIVKTGGIFIKTSVDNAKIYIDDKYANSTSGILNHDTLITNLVPRNYTVFIYKENYYPWNKVIEVKNGMVVELRNIILFPLELQKTKLLELPDQVISEFSISDNAIKINNNKAKTTKTYSLADGKLLTTEKFRTATSSSEDSISPDKNKKIYISNNQLWLSYLNDINKEPIKKTGEKELITVYQSSIDLFDWFNDSEHLIWFANGELSVAELDNQSGKRNSIKFYLNINPPVFWDRANSDFYFFEGNILYKINFKS